MCVGQAVTTSDAAAAVQLAAARVADGIPRHVGAEGRAGGAAGRGDAREAAVQRKEEAKGIGEPECALCENERD